MRVSYLLLVIFILLNSCQDNKTAKSIKEYSLDDIENLVNELADEINAPANYLPTYGYSLDGARPHIEIDTDGLVCYVVVERGAEFERSCYIDINKLLYKVFSDVVFVMATDYEVKHRIENEDSRRQWFAKEIELLSVLNKQWAEWQRE
ncbi:MAG TPA: Imm63 family immunity protein, partial [Bacteroidia bacterium]|nr:Imm63 family immunity protein [Bacteroidia bacterium]